MVSKLAKCLVLLVFGCGLASASAAEFPLYPEEEMMKHAFEQAKLHFPLHESYNIPLTMDEASALVYDLAGQCTPLCPSAPLFSKNPVTQGDFLEQLYRKEMPTRAEKTAQQFPLLKGTQMLYVRDAWKLGLVGTYSSTKTLSSFEGMDIVYRYVALKANKDLGLTRYQDGMVYDTSVITPHFFQSQEQLKKIVASYDEWIAGEKKAKRKQELQARRDLFANVYTQIVQDDATYQQRPFGLPLQADMGSEVVISYGFHDPRYKSHTGVDIAPYHSKKAELGDLSVVARQSGLAIFVKWDIPESASNKWSYTRSLNGYGNHVIILSEDFFRRVQGDRSLSKNKEVFATLYGHLKSFDSYDSVDTPAMYVDLMKKFYFGERNVGNYVFANLKIVGVKTVNVGDVLGVMGTTGRSTGEHLHYEVRKIEGELATAQFQNPEDFHLDIPHSEVVFEGEPDIARGGGAANPNSDH